MRRGINEAAEPALCRGGRLFAFRGGDEEDQGDVAARAEGNPAIAKRYGDQLVCVRYRYDAARQKRLKTVQLVADEQDWVPGIRFIGTERVLLRIGYDEFELREAVKSAGSGTRRKRPGFWNGLRRWNWDWDWD